MDDVVWALWTKQKVWLCDDAVPVPSFPHGPAMASQSLALIPADSGHQEYAILVLNEITKMKDGTVKVV